MYDIYIDKCLVPPQHTSSFLKALALMMGYFPDSWCDSDAVTHFGVDQFMAMCCEYDVGDEPRVLREGDEIFADDAEDSAGSHTQAVEFDLKLVENSISIKYVESYNSSAEARKLLETIPGLVMRVWKPTDDEDSWT